VVTGGVTSFLARLTPECADDANSAERLVHPCVDLRAVFADRSPDRPGLAHVEHARQRDRRHADQRRDGKLPAQIEENDHREHDANERDARADQRLLDQSANGIDIAREAGGDPARLHLRQAVERQADQSAEEALAQSEDHLGVELRGLVAAVGFQQLLKDEQDQNGDADFV
jgi:hypothetical protein